MGFWTCIFCGRQVPDQLRDFHVNNECENLKETPSGQETPTPSASPISSGNHDPISSGSKRPAPQSDGASSEPPLKRAQTCDTNAPLAERMRPTDVDSLVGQTIVAKDSVLRRIIESGENIPSLIFWGPPGVGKTTLAGIISRKTRCHWVSTSAVTANVQVVRNICAEAQNRRKLAKQKTIVFLDEIHRFNKAQQDSLLPHVESGLITLIGATTENPSFQCNSALLSRCRVFTLDKLTTADILSILRTAAGDRDRGLGCADVHVAEEALEFLANMADGDARTALNTLDIAFNAGVARSKNGGDATVTTADIKASLQKSHLVYDRKGDQHYNVISALHKSIRGSDVDAALYWMGRMLEGGEEPLFIARRLVRAASEDIGLADPQALIQATTTFTACTYLGMPECDVILAQCVAYLARAPKSNDVYSALNAVKAAIKQEPTAPVPLHLCNAPTKLMKDLGYGREYKYNHDHQAEDLDQPYLPEALLGRTFFNSGPNVPPPSSKTNTFPKQTP